VEGIRALGAIGVALVLGTLLVVPSAAAAAAAQTTPDDPAQQLAERYAPFVAIREQTAECDTEGEQWAPADADIVLGNPEVVLRGPDDEVLIEGPTAADLFAATADDYLDFPGDSIRPDCDFERDFRRFNGDRAPVVYAHVVAEEDRPGLLALQYWTFWYYNHWNNTHEGDWEGIQLVFEADSAEEALATEPVEVGFAQHEGGERQDWDDPTVEREGDRLVLHASAGSHASYFDTALYLGRSASEGFGCDDTRTPVERLDPEVVLLPDRVEDAEDPLAWLAWEGRWGQRQRGPWNGPTGPADKDRWTEPITWQESLRDSSVTVPGRSTFGTSATDAFCTTVGAGSTAVLVVLREPLLALALLALAVVVIGAALRVARPVLRTARLRYRARRRDWATVGLVFVPVGILAAGIQAALVRLPGIGPFAELLGDDGAGVAVAVLAGTVEGVVATILVHAVVASMLRAEDDGEDLDVLAAYRAQLRRWREIVSAALWMLVTLTALTATVIGLPFAVRLLVRWGFVGTAVADEGVGGRAALRASGRGVDGRWWRSAAVLAVSSGVAIAAGPVVGFLLMLLTDLPLGLVNVVGSVVYVVTVPLAGLAVTLWWRRATPVAEA
jgi:hypothetical protein